MAKVMEAWLKEYLVTGSQRFGQEDPRVAVTVAREISACATSQEWSRNVPGVIDVLNDGCDQVFATPELTDPVERCPNLERIEESAERIGLVLK